MNRLRSHFADQQALKAPRRLQSDIVREYRDDIVELISSDGARLPEVVAAVRAQGEPVLEPGFKAEILKQIGKTKDIRAGKLKGAPSQPASTTPSSPSTPAPALPVPSVGKNDPTASQDDDDDDHFAARRPRG